MPRRRRRGNGGEVVQNTIDISSQFLPKSIADALTRLWVMDGHHLIPILDDAGEEYTCPITLECITSPVVLCDGYPYEESAALQWLENNTRSPYTNLPLAHASALKLTPLRETIEHFLSKQQVSGNCTRQELQRAVQAARACDEDKYSQLATLESQISIAVEAASKLEAVICEAKNLRDELSAQIRIHENDCATRIQALLRGIWSRTYVALLKMRRSSSARELQAISRSFLAQQLLSNLSQAAQNCGRRQQACATKIQALRRGHLCRKLVARLRKQWSSVCGLQAVAKSYLAKLSLISLSAPPGTLVMLTGLSKLELNGSRGEVQQRLPNGRVSVCLDNGKVVSVKPENVWACRSDLTCAACSRESTMSSRCDVCRLVVYCSRECQETHWNVHKANCWRISQFKGRVGEASICREPGAYVIVQGEVRFPPPQRIIINMMPFIMGDSLSLPPEYRHYWPLVESCPLDKNEYGEVGYLTIHESIVSPGESQRRGGIHTETPGIVLTDNGGIRTGVNWGQGCYVYGGPKNIIYPASDPDDPIYRFYNEPFGCGPASVRGGIYMASTVPNSCRVWSAKIKNPESVVGPFGDISHLRQLLGRGDVMPANQLWWLTDTTPHESLQVEGPVYRQYFRLVTSSVSVWYRRHSTPNRLGIEPECQIINHDKFEAFARWQEQQ